MCPDKEFSLVRIFPYLVRIRENTEKNPSLFGHLSHNDRLFIYIDSINF